MRYANHNILIDDPHPQSLASLVFLTRKLAPRPIGYKTWLKYRKHLLREKYRADKTLRCYYCGKGPLQAHSDREDDIATLDHVKPLSKGGARFLSTNIVVACHSCNCRKKDMDMEEFKNLIV